LKPYFSRFTLVNSESIKNTKNQQEESLNHKRRGYYFSFRVFAGTLEKTRKKLKNQLTQN